MLSAFKVQGIKHRRAKGVLFHNILTETGAGKSKLSQHICLPPIKMWNVEALTNDLLSRAPSNRYIFIIETKGVMPLINRHLFQQMSQGDVGSSHLPICTHLKAVGVTALGARGQGAYGFSHITLERILTAQEGRLWDASQAKHWQIPFWSEPAKFLCCLGWKRLSWVNVMGRHVASSFTNCFP